MEVPKGMHQIPIVLQVDKVEMLHSVVGCQIFKAKMEELKAEEEPEEAIVEG